MGFSENNTFEKILDRMLSQDILINVDKREGSIIYDAIAPCAMELAEAYAMIDILQEQTYLMTATGVNLDKRVYDYGISRNMATRAQRIGEFKKIKVDENGGKTLVDMDIAVGSRFIDPDNASVVFEYIGKIEGYNILECETAGAAGNRCMGVVLPVIPIAGLAEARIVDTYAYGEDEETDEELRERTKNHLNYTPYGGNVADYIEKVNSIGGVGQTKVFPAWQHNGSVLLSIVDPSFNPVTPEFMRVVKERIDPDNATGQGVGVAPIGHYVTVTTPVSEVIDVALTVQLKAAVSASLVQESVKDNIEEYFRGVRRSYRQNSTLAIYRARIIEMALKCDDVLNVTSVRLNSKDEDIVYVDEASMGGQHLPYLGEVAIE